MKPLLALLLFGWLADILGVTAAQEQQEVFCKAHGYSRAFVGRWGSGCIDASGRQWFSWQVERKS